MLQLDALRRVDNGHALVAARRDALIKTAPPLVSALFRRQRIRDALRRLDFDGAARDVTFFGGPQALRCVGPAENTGGRALAEASDADDIRNVLGDVTAPGPPRSFIVERGPSGTFDIADQLVPRRDVRVRCFVTVRSKGKGSAIVRAGSSGGIAVWTGGAGTPQIIDRGEHPFVADVVAVPVQLSSKPTRIAVEVSLLDFGGTLDLRITTPTGAPEKGLAFSISDDDLRASGAAEAPQAVSPSKMGVAADAIGPALGAKRARAYASYLRHTGAYDHRVRPSARRVAIDAWMAAARVAGDDDDLAAAFVDSADDLGDDDNVTAAMAALNDALALPRLSAGVRADVFAAMAKLREQQGDSVGAARAWNAAVDAAPDAIDHFTERASFERRRRVLGAPHDRAIVAAAKARRYAPLWRLAADVADDRGDVVSALAFLDDAGEKSARLSREIGMLEARLATDPAARTALKRALGTRLRLMPSSHITAERLTMLHMDDDGDGDAAADGIVDDIVNTRARRFALRPEPLRLRAKVSERRGDRDAALVALRAALALTPDNGDVQRLIRDMANVDGNDLAARLLPPFDAAVAADARKNPPDGAADIGAFIHSKVVATRFFENGNLERVEDLVVVVTDAHRVSELRRWSWGYSGDREALVVLAAERLSADGRKEAPNQNSDRGSDSKENGAYSDGRVASVGFAGISDGDVFHLRVRKETVGLQNQFGDFFGDLEILDGPLPTRQLKLLYEGPSSRPLFRGGRGAPEPTVVTADGVTQTTFTLNDLPAIAPEPLMPAYFEVARYVSVSTYKDWGALGAWYERLIGDQLALDDELRQVVKTLKASSSDRQDLVRRIYEHVVTHTRYVGIELGIHGWKPYAVTEVYRRRFGDCKDKASLLVAMLREADIDAHITLVRTTQLGHAAAEPASMWAFNHAIAWVKEFDLFLDGTAERHGVGELPTMDQGALALIVDGAASRLVTIPIAPAAANENTSSYVLRLQPDGAIIADGDERYRGSRAPPERRRFEDAANRTQTFEAELSQMIPGAQVQSLEVSPLDLSTSQVGYRFRALLPKRAAVERDGTLALPLSLYPHDLSGSYASASGRRFDISIDRPWRTRNVMRYIVPSGMKVLDLPAGGTVETPHLRFVQVVTKTDDGFIVDEDTAILQRRIGVDDYAQFRAAALAADRLMKRKIRIVPGAAR